MSYRSHNGWLIRDQEFSLVMNLRGHVGAVHYSPECEDWIFCQSTLHNLVRCLINGETAAPRKSLAGLFYRYFPSTPRLWRGCSVSRVGPYSQRLQKHLGDPPLTSHKLYAAINEAEVFLQCPPPEIETTHYSVVVNGCARASSSLMNSIRARLAPAADHFSVYIHGSMATEDNTLFSDVDDLVLLHRSAWSSHKQFEHVARSLEKVTVLFQAIDPLQHHGHWLYTDLDLLCLDQTEIPLHILTGAVPLVGNRLVEAWIRKLRTPFPETLWSIIQEVRRDAFLLSSGLANLYILKNLVSGISLLPALAFQLSGALIDKKTAINQSSSLFSQCAMDAISWASTVRSSWGECPGFSRIRALSKINRIVPWRRSAMEGLARRWSPAVRPGPGVPLVASIVPAIYTLTDECANLILGIAVCQSHAV
jgi:hypothetical protein